MGGRASQGLVAVRQRVEHWRKDHGGRGSRIPEDLWNEAARVARVAGVYATARALRFNYERLRDRVAGAKGEGRSAKGPEPAFVELEMGPTLGAGSAVVELVGRGGDQMRIHLTGASTADLVGLAQTFWSRQS